MFTRIRYKIAIFFSVISFLGLVLQGGLVIFYGYVTDMRILHANIAQDAQRIMLSIQEDDNFVYDRTFTLDSNRIRIFNDQKEPTFVGLIFQTTERTFSKDPFKVKFNRTSYLVNTFEMYANNELAGYIQVGERYSTLPSRLKNASFGLLVQSLLFSIITFFAALHLEKRALKPIYEANKRLKTFAQNAGHELRTPIANVRSTLEVAKLTKEYNESIDQSIAELDHLTKLINTLMHLVTLNKSHVKKDLINLSVIADEILLKFVREAKQKGIKLTSNISPDIVRLADRELVIMALSNLVQNALKFTNKGQSVHIHVTKDRLQVIDTGIGMSPEVQGKIFERFFKADIARNEDGFGLGLTLVQKICTLHNWKISVSSVLGEGTVFTITF